MKATGRTGCCPQDHIVWSLRTFSSTARQLFVSIPSLQVTQKWSGDGPFRAEVEPSLEPDKEMTGQKSQTTAARGSLTAVPCACQRPCVKKPAKVWIVQDMASIPGLVSGRVGMLQGACTRMHSACTFRMSTGQQHLLCQQAFPRSSLATSASSGPVDSIFNHAQALVATGISAVGMATIADKSSK